MFGMYVLDILILVESKDWLMIGLWAPLDLDVFIVYETLENKMTNMHFSIKKGARPLICLS